MGTELSVYESVEIAKSVATGVKKVVMDFNGNFIVWKSEIQVLKDELNKKMVMQRMRNVKELYVREMDILLDFMERYDVENMDPGACRFFNKKLEELNNNLDRAINDYVNR